MATVYLAEDLRHERKVALKVLKPELAAVVGAERFLAELTTCKTGAVGLEPTTSWLTASHGSADFHGFRGSMRDSPSDLVDDFRIIHEIWGSQHAHKHAQFGGASDVMPATDSMSVSVKALKLDLADANPCEVM